MIDNFREKFLHVDSNKRALDYFKYSSDWIDRHWNCETCDKREWKNVAFYLNKTIMKLIETGDFYKVIKLEEIKKK